METILTCIMHVADILIDDPYFDLEQAIQDKTISGLAYYSDLPHIHGDETHAVDVTSGLGGN